MTLACRPVACSACTPTHSVACTSCSGSPTRIKESLMALAVWEMSIKLMRIHKSPVFSKRKTPAPSEPALAVRWGFLWGLQLRFSSNIMLTTQSKFSKQLSVTLSAGCSSNVWPLRTPQPKRNWDSRVTQRVDWVPATCWLHSHQLIDLFTDSGFTFFNSIPSGICFHDT